MTRFASSALRLATLFSVATGLASTAHSQYTAELVVSGLNNPMLVTAPKGDLNRLFIVEQAGRVKVMRDGQMNATLFLNITGVVAGGGERGLLGFAFHPDFLSNGRFFASYTNNNGHTRIREYEVTGDPATDDESDGPVQLIFGIDQPFSNHNGGNILFGADGKLYAGLGDGGSANDPGNRAQNPTNNLGKMLRFDIDIPSPFIPSDNPFVGDPSTNDEIWALGVRNPWRFTFDRETGDMWMGDVGQNAREEVNFELAGDGGRNYGWRCMEGFNCTGLSGCTCNDIALTLPVTDYTHGDGCSITGGYLYRGCIPELYGKYIYADYCSARFWTYDPSNGAEAEVTSLIQPATGPTVGSITSFGEDGAGELYICDQGGEIFKVVPTSCATSSYCATSPNSAGPGAVIGSSGSLSVFDNDFTLEATGLPSMQNGLFYYGPDQVQVPFGDGAQCVDNSGGGVYRLPVVASTSAGDASHTVDMIDGPASMGPGTILGCSSWNFQFWYRDPSGPGGSGFNLSDGLNVVFCP